MIVSNKCCDIWWLKNPLGTGRVKVTTYVIKLVIQNADIDAMVSNANYDIYSSQTNEWVTIQMQEGINRQAKVGCIHNISSTYGFHCI